MVTVVVATHTRSPGHGLLHLPVGPVKATAGRQADSIAIYPRMNLGSARPLLEPAALPKNLSERRHKLANVKQTAAWQHNFADIKIMTFSQYGLEPKPFLSLANQR